MIQLGSSRSPPVGLRGQQQRAAAARPLLLRAAPLPRLANLGSGARRAAPLQPPRASDPTHSSSRSSSTSTSLEPRQRPLPPPGSSNGADDGPAGGGRRPSGIVQWLRSLAQRPSPAAVARLLSYLRVILLGCASALLLSAIRTYASAKARTAPREVLYSDFVTLVDQKRVRAARLEAGTGKLFFDVHLPAAAAAQAPTKQQQKQKQAATAAQAATAGSAVLPARAKPALAKHFYVKVADKADPLLISKVLGAGIEFGVSRPGFQAQLGNVLLTTLALWLSLLPLLFFLRRMMDSRTGGTQRKKKASSGAPPVTFADVAGA
jgi:hypothetical protein